MPFFSTHATPGTFFAATDIPSDYNCKITCPTCGTNAGAAGKVNGNITYAEYTTGDSSSSSVYQGYINKKVRYQEQ